MRVLRDGAEMLVPLEEIVPGDVVLLSAGAMIPADCRLLEARDLFVNEAALTGETYPGEKTPGAISATIRAGAAHQRRLHGHARRQRQRQSGRRSHRSRDRSSAKFTRTLRLRPPETEFEHGIRRFGYLLAEVTFCSSSRSSLSTFTSTGRSSIRSCSRSRSRSG